MVKTRTGKDTSEGQGRAGAAGGKAGGGKGKEAAAAVGRKKTARKQKCGRVHQSGVKCAGCATAGVTDWAAYEKRMRKLGRSYVRRSTGGKMPRRQLTVKKK